MPYEKVGKNEPVCIADQIPFDIPDSWEWVRLSTANDMYTGNSINENEKKQKYTGLSDGYFYIGTKDVGFDHTINYDNGVRIPYDNEKFRIAPQNSILLCVEVQVEKYLLLIKMYVLEINYAALYHLGLITNSCIIICKAHYFKVHLKRIQLV